MDIQILLFIQENIRNYILTPFFTLITNEYFLYAILFITIFYSFYLVKMNLLTISVLY